MFRSSALAIHSDFLTIEARFDWILTMSWNWALLAVAIGCHQMQRLTASIFSLKYVGSHICAHSAAFTDWWSGGTPIVSVWRCVCHRLTMYRKVIRVSLTHLAFHYRFSTECIFCVAILIWHSLSKIKPYVIIVLTIYFIWEIQILYKI